MRQATANFVIMTHIRVIARRKENLFFNKEDPYKEIGMTNDWVPDEIISCYERKGESYKVLPRLRLTSLTTDLSPPYHGIR